jgi:hypothetical protein
VKETDKSLVQNYIIENKSKKSTQFPYCALSGFKAVLNRSKATHAPSKIDQKLCFVDAFVYRNEGNDAAHCKKLNRTLANLSPQSYLEGFCDKKANYNSYC